MPDKITFVETYPEFNSLTKELDMYSGINNATWCILPLSEINSIFVRFLYCQKLYPMKVKLVY